jgi:hypothetical protein
MNLHQQLARNRLSAALELERNPSVDQSKWLAEIAELEQLCKQCDVVDTDVIAEVS